MNETVLFEIEDIVAFDGDGGLIVILSLADDDVQPEDEE